MSLLQHAVFTKLDWAIILATQYHSDTVDKGGEPYIFHPLRVMLAMRGMHGGGEESQIVAVLHDVVEESRKHKRDQLHLSEIHSRFGKRIHDAIHVSIMRVRSRIGQDILHEWRYNSDQNGWYYCGSVRR